MEFKGIIKRNGRLATLDLPFNAKTEFNVLKGPIFVFGTINYISFRGKLLSRGNNSQFLIIPKQLQKEISYVNGMEIFATMMSKLKNDELI